MATETKTVESLESADILLAFIAEKIAPKIAEFQGKNSRLPKWTEIPVVGLPDKLRNILTAPNEAGERVPRAYKGVAIPPSRLLFARLVGNYKRVLADKENPPAAEVKDMAIAYGKLYAALKNVSGTKRGRQAAKRISASAAKSAKNALAGIKL